MSLDHRFVFADNLVLRCKCDQDEYFPIEILDFEDILGRLNNLFLIRLDTRRNSNTSPTKKTDTGSFKNRLFVFDSVKSATPASTSDGELTTSTDRSPRSGSSPDATSNIRRQDSIVLQVSPLMRHRRKSKNATNITQDQQHHKKNQFLGVRQNSDPVPPTGITKTNSCITSSHSSYKQHNKDIVNCLNESSPDFVHVSTFCDIESAEEFLRHLRDSCDVKTVAIDIYISTDLSISITYQRLINFKQDFMMLDLKRTDFMFFLKPF